MTIREVINRLEKLSRHDGVNDHDEVRVEINGEVYDIKSIMLRPDPDYNFDESNCGPEIWAEISVEE